MAARAFVTRHLPRSQDCPGKTFLQCSLHLMFWEGSLLADGAMPLSAVGERVRGPGVAQVPHRLQVNSQAQPNAVLVGLRLESVGVDAALTARNE